MFEISGKFLRKFTTDRLKYPHGICADSADNILVADFGPKCVWIFSSAGVLVTTIKTDDSGACKLGGDVWSVCTDKDNRVLLGGNSKLQVLGFTAWYSV